MPTRVAIIVAAALVMTAALTRPTYAGMLLGSSGGVIYDIDALTGLASNPRETGLTGMAITYGNGTLYGSPGRSLYMIDVPTGSAELAGELSGIEPPQVTYDLTWDPTTDTLFALVHLGGTSTDDLYTIDTSTLTAGHVGRLQGRYDTIAFDSSGMLFALDPVDNVLQTIDKTSAGTTSTVLLSSDVAFGASMAFDEIDSLYLATGRGDDPSVLHLLDPENGVLTPIGSTGLERVPSMAYIPEPATLALVFTGGLALHRRKRRKALRSAIVAIAIVAGLTVPTQAGTLVGSSFGVIYDIDPLTGVASNPRDTGGSVGRIEFGNGTLYGASVRSLYAVDILTGEAEFLGELDGLEVPQLVYDMAWDETTDSLFALVHTGGTTLDELYTIDTATLEVRGVGRLDDGYDALAFDPNGGLFGIDPLNDLLGTIDKTNAETTSTLALTPQLDLGAAMTFGDGGALYVVTNVREDPCVLHLLDPQNGVLTPIGSTGLNHGISTLTYIPEPGTLILLGIGSLAVCRRRRRLPVVHRNAGGRRSGPGGGRECSLSGWTLAVAIVVATFLFQSVAAGQGPGLGPRPVYSALVNGNFVATGWSISSARGTQQGAGATVTLTIDIPGGASVVKAYANWSYLTDTPDDADLRTITVNEYPVTVEVDDVISSMSDDICQLDLPLHKERTGVYLADITDIVAAGINEYGHGTYDIENVVENDDEEFGPLGEGISLLVVYSESTEPLRLINVYSGLIQTDKDVWEAEATLGFVDENGRPVRYVGGPVHFFVNALDGQDGRDAFQINEHEPSAFLQTSCGLHGGSWCGEIGPGPEGCNWYDHADCNGDDDPECDANAYMNLNDEQIVITQIKLPFDPEIQVPPDCIGHSFAAVAFEYVPCPVIHVDRDAPGGTGPGTSWDNAYHRLQDALANVDPLCSGPGATIRVAEGVYRPDQDENHILGSNDPAATFQLVNHVCLEGGYAGYGRPNRNFRDFEGHETVLSGVLDEGARSYHVVTGPPSGDGESCAVLEGFTITGGNANGTQDADKQGGGVYVSGGSPTINNCTFTGNSAAHTGGGVTIIGASPVVSECAFLGNSANLGAGIAVEGGSPRVTNCRFIANTATTGGGGLSLTTWANLALTNCLFAANSGGLRGAGLYIQQGSGTVSNCTFAGNKATNSGGGLCSSNATVEVRNSILWGNMSPEGYGPEIALLGNSGSLAVRRSDVQGGEGAVFKPLEATLTWDQSNFDGDPVFRRNPNPGPDGNWDGEDDDYGDLHLTCGSPGSPCIDAGDNTLVPSDAADLDGDRDVNERTPVDLDGRWRFVDDVDTDDSGVPDPPGYPNIVDLGPYEYFGLQPPLPAAYHWPCGDDGDCPTGTSCLGGVCHAPKNRALSFVPNNPRLEVAFQVELTAVGPAECYKHCDSGNSVNKSCETDADCDPPGVCCCDPTADVGMTWWVSRPRCTDKDGDDVTATDPNCAGISSDGVDNVWRAQLTAGPVCHGGANNDLACAEDQHCPDGKCGKGLWPNDTIHIADCEVIPIAEYVLRATENPLATEPVFSTDLHLETIDRPAAPKCWGDVAGAWTGDHWTGPNGEVNMDDIQAAVFFFTRHPTMPDRMWPEVDDKGPNMVLNFADITMIIATFGGNPYPFANPLACSEGVSAPLRDGGADGGLEGDEAMMGEGGAAPLGEGGGAALEFSLVADAEFIEAEQVVGVNVYVGSVSNLGGYEISLEVTGGDSGALVLESLLVDVQRSDYVFGTVTSLPAEALLGERLGAASMDGGVDVVGPGYLGTFSYRASADAHGVFQVSVRGAGRSFLLDSNVETIECSLGDGAQTGCGVECFLEEHCDDDSPCNDDLCIDGVCENINDDTNSCEDGDDCTDNECVSGNCVTTDKPAGAPCDDGLFCTAVDECDGSGACVGSGNPCVRPTPKCCEDTEECVGKHEPCPILYP